tara:strand:+ start:1817 stop:1990 length:174 start_codon:yes stop_codon:yes gene_type:complete
MDCWYCGTELIWGGDIDIEEEFENFCMETNLSCPNSDCRAEVIMYLPKQKGVNTWKQ